eukprot:6212735-Pleurochrysis_carterae.AAC.4
MRGARSGVDAFVGEELSELSREELPCVVAVESPHHTCRGVASFVEQSCEAGEKKPNMFGRFVLVSQHMNGLESSVVVDDNECVTASSIDGGEERSGYVHVNEAARVRWLIEVVWMWQAREIGFCTGCARGRHGIAQTPGSVRCEVCELFETRIAAMKPAMHVMSGLVGGHNLNVRCRTQGMNGEGARASGARVAACYMPFE